MERDERHRIDIDRQDMSSRRERDRNLRPKVAFAVRARRIEDQQSILGRCGAFSEPGAEEKFTIFFTIHFFIVLGSGSITPIGSQEIRC